LAASHPLAIGDAKYRFSSKAQSVDTVPFGSFKRETLDQIGHFDESLKANEDYELNARIRSAGGIVWFNPAIHSVYFARPTFLALAQQYARYGYWKWRMLLRFPETIKWRQALPPTFVFGLIFGPLFAIILPWLAIPWQLAVVSYALLLLAIAFQKSLQKSNFSILFGMPLAIFIMHLSFGSAMIWSIFHSFLYRN
jgi:succinoglycan biosynthesis protein ExoA